MLKTFSSCSNFSTSFDYCARDNHSESVCTRSQELVHQRMLAPVANLVVSQEQEVRAVLSSPYRSTPSQSRLVLDAAQSTTSRSVRNSFAARTAQKHKCFILQQRDICMPKRFYVQPRRLHAEIFVCWPSLLIFLNFTIWNARDQLYYDAL